VSTWRYGRWAPREGDLCSVRKGGRELDSRKIKGFPQTNMKKDISAHRVERISSDRDREEGEERVKLTGKKRDEHAN